MSIEASLRALAGKWAAVPAGESANFPLYIRDLTDALGVPPPPPRGSGYELEYPVKVMSRGGTQSTNFVDLYKEGCFVLEAKHTAEGASNDALLRAAYGQAHSYALAIPGGPPPYVLVLDVARTLLVWDRWQGGFGGFNLAQRISLPTLAERPEDIAYTTR